MDFTMITFKKGKHIVRRGIGRYFLKENITFFTNVDKFLESCYTK